MRDCFNIDEMSVKDIDETVHLEEIIFSHPWSKKSIESTLLSSDNICLVVYDSEKNIQAGYCIFTTSFEDADLCRIAVLNDYRRNHLADRMLKKAFEKLETNGVKRVILEV